MRTPDLIRFERAYMPITESGCWLWMLSTDGRGYGQFLYKNKNIKAYRAAFDLFRGPVPEGKVIDHLCRVRLCVNPNHLEPVSFKENVLRGESPTAINARKTHCIRGHEFTEKNTYKQITRGFYKGDACRKCRKAATDKSYAEKRRLQKLNKASNK